MLDFFNPHIKNLNNEIIIILLHQYTMLMINRT